MTNDQITMTNGGMQIDEGDDSLDLEVTNQGDTALGNVDPGAGGGATHPRPREVRLRLVRALASGVVALRASARERTARLTRWL